MSASPLGSNGGTNVAGRDNCFQYSYSSLPSHQCGLRNNFESIIFILQNPQKDIHMKIYLSIFSLITKTTSTNPSQFPYSPLSRHCYNQWWGRPKRMQNDSKGNYRKRLCETRRRKCYCHLMSTSKLRGETRPPGLNTN